MIESEELELSIDLKHTIHSIKLGTPKRIFLLLHGYLLDGAYLLNELKDTLPTDSLIIAPNGPFLVPVKKGERYSAKYAWYFFDPHTKDYYVNYDPAAKYLTAVLEKYNSEKLPVSIIGYSQGGYLAPRVANFCKEVDQVISLASVFRPERFDIMPNVSYSQINSKGDLVVSMSEAIDEGEIMKERGAQYTLDFLENSGHRLDEHYKELLKLRIKQ